MLKTYKVIVDEFPRLATALKEFIVLENNTHDERLTNVRNQIKTLVGLYYPEWDVNMLGRTGTAGSSVWIEIKKEICITVKDNEVNHQLDNKKLQKVLKGANTEIPPNPPTYFDSDMFDLEN
jgi:hypothetical protein